MTRTFTLAPLVLALALPLAAQSTPTPKASAAAKAVVADTTEDADTTDEGEGKPGLQYGMAGGSLQYTGGRSEQAIGGVLRWVPVSWLSLSATPTRVRVQEPASGTLAASSRSGWVDLPLEASLSHTFEASMHPTLSAGLGITLPIGDTASGLGSGTMGYATSVGFGLSPSEKLWLHASAGRSLSNFSVQSAFTGSSGWGDISAGTPLSDILSASVGFSSDLGAVDSTIGRSTSLTGGLSLAVRGPVTVNLNMSHGLSGVAPNWGFTLGLGTAFPYLNHLGAGSSLSTLQQTFGGGTHGLTKGTGSGTSTTRTTRGRRGP